MPLCKLQATDNHISWGIWKIDETHEELWHELDPTSESQLELQAIHHPQKKLEWLASRLVIRQLVEKQGFQFHGIYKDAFGKPHLSRLSSHISIAHCFPLAAGAFHKSHPVGIDIEKPREKLLRIRDRFLSKSEARQAGDNLDWLCKYWTGKEVLYKIYGRKKLIFRENIYLQPAVNNSEQLLGQINLGTFGQSFEIRINRLQGHYVAFSAAE